MWNIFDSRTLESGYIPILYIILYNNIIVNRYRVTGEFRKGHSHNAPQTPKSEPKSFGYPE
jgi:hypothetical protein